jgi:hypothetical protein
MVSGRGIMFATRPEAAAAELAHVCRKGGRIALTSWLSDSNLFKMFLVMKPACQRAIAHMALPAEALAFLRGLVRLLST